MAEETARKWTENGVPASLVEYEVLLSYPKEQKLVLNMGNGNYALKDEGSANGTKINGQLLNKYQTQPLQEGDRIQLGQTVLVFARR